MVAHPASHSLKFDAACVFKMAIEALFKISAPTSLFKKSFLALARKLLELEVIVLPGPLSGDGGALAEGSPQQQRSTRQKQRLRHRPTQPRGYINSSLIHKNSPLKQLPPLLFTN